MKPNAARVQAPNFPLGAVLEPIAAQDVLRLVVQLGAVVAIPNGLLAVLRSAAASARDSDGWLRSSLLWDLQPMRRIQVP